MTGEDTIKSTIKKLRTEKAYNVRTNASYYSDRVIEEINERFGKDAKYVFYTRYASLGNFDIDGNLTGMLTLDWQGDAEEIIETFEEAGFTVEWAGSKDDLIIILPKNDDSYADLKSKTIELDRYLYDLKDGSGEYLLIIKNKKNEETYYEGFKGKLEELWLFLGKKGADCNNNKLLIDLNGKVSDISIENYIELYSNLFKEEKGDIGDLFNNFEIIAVGAISKKEYEETIKLMGNEGENLKKLLSLEELEEDTSSLKFEKEIKNEDDFIGINQNFSDGLGWRVKFKINKI